MNWTLYWTFAMYMAITFAPVGLVFWGVTLTDPYASKKRNTLGFSMIFIGVILVCSGFIMAIDAISSPKNRPAQVEASK